MQPFWTLTVAYLQGKKLFQCISIGNIKDETENGAASVIRTRDLTLTKGALYRWSYGSTCTRFTSLDRALQGRLAPTFFRSPGPTLKRKSSFWPTFVLNLIFLSLTNQQRLWWEQRMWLLTTKMNSHSRKSIFLMRNQNCILKLNPYSCRAPKLRFS